MHHSETSSAISNPAIAAHSPQSSSWTRHSSFSNPSLNYLWATYAHPPSTPVVKMGEKVGDRYHVISPHVWQDTQPFTPCNPHGQIFSSLALSYLRLQTYALHLPTLYGVISLVPRKSPDPLKPNHPDTEQQHTASQGQKQRHSEQPPQSSILLLDNIPVDASGQLLPSIPRCWSGASAVRQVHWLWQLLELWHVLRRWDQTSSLLAPDNIRVDGWRLRLVNVWGNEEWRNSGPPKPFNQNIPFTNPQEQQNPIHWHLGKLWQSWADQGHASLIGPLTHICEQLQHSHCSWNRVKHDLNVLLLKNAAQQPLHLSIVGRGPNKTKQGSSRTSFYPPSRVAQSSQPSPQPPPTSSQDPDLMSADDIAGGFKAPKPWEELEPYVGIVCEGTDDHGGSLASQLVMRSLKLQLGAFLTELEGHQTTSDLIAPDVLSDQLAAIIRIVNNVLLAQNHSHQASHQFLNASNDNPSPQAIRTTATLAIQIPQSVSSSRGARNGHELYVASIGNSRAYWITPTHCHCLTQDDDVASRTFLRQLGRDRGTNHRGWSYHDAKLQADSTCLAQTLGTKEGEQLTIQVRRLILDEDGVLVLCSHALGDRIADHGQSIATRILQDGCDLEQAVQELDLESNASPLGAHSGQSAQSTKGAVTHPDDNAEASLVLMRCQVSEPESPLATHPDMTESTRLALDIALAQQAATEETMVSVSPKAIALDQATGPDVQAAPQKADLNSPLSPTPESDSAESMQTQDPPPSPSEPEAPVDEDFYVEPEDADAEIDDQPSWHWIQLVGGCMAAIIGTVVLGLTAWRYLDPVLFDRVVVQSTEQFLDTVQEKYPWLDPSDQASDTSSSDASGVAPSSDNAAEDPGE